MKAKCREFSHTFEVIKQDENYTFEECSECGEKKRFSKHDARNEYAIEHSIDTLQLWDKRFVRIYPDSVKRINEEKKKMEIEKQTVDEKLEMAGWQAKRGSMTSRFVH